MRKSLIDISEKIDKKRLKAIEAIAEIAGSLKIPFFIIGASARDFLLSYGHDIATTRATLDVDIGVRVPDWDRYGELRKGLIETGEFIACEEAHRFSSQGFVRRSKIGHFRATLNEKKRFLSGYS